MSPLFGSDQTNIWHRSVLLLTRPLQDGCGRSDGVESTDLGDGVLHGAVVLSGTFLQLLQEGLVIGTVYMEMGSDRRTDQRPAE